MQEEDKEVKEIKKALEEVVYDRERMFPGSHECAHYVEMFGRPCIRPAYREEDGKWWCESCYFTYSSKKNLGWCSAVTNGYRCKHLATIKKEGGNVCDVHAKR